MTCHKLMMMHMVCVGRVVVLPVVLVYRRCLYFEQDHQAKHGCFPKILWERLVPNSNRG